ncbi:MAG: hypothetical protein J6Q25_02095, partial [Bacteroidales bacterium]|nr:hypothetical protein [Bacteroidales bacterium]
KVSANLEMNEVRKERLPCEPRRGEKFSAKLEMNEVRKERLPCEPRRGEKVSAKFEMHTHHFITTRPSEEMK